MKRQIFALAVLFGVLLPQCQAQYQKMDSDNDDTLVGADTSLVFIDKAHYTSAAMQLDDYLPLIQGKRVGVVGNQTSIVGTTHLVDTLLSLGINVKKIFTPEHGFRGTADAGAKVNSGKDEKTGLPIVSLYGKTKKPTDEMLQDLDVILFDLQDVGVRFYTYISTMTYVMDAAAENNIPVIVLDRPNPNGFYVDGPVLDPDNASFVGMHEVPVVYGMTIGEYANMVNGEGWLKGCAIFDLKCDLTVIPMKEYNRNAIYELPVKPSPNLPTWESVYLYPTLCFFEGTIVSVGRGTDKPFQIFGYPALRGDYTFTPKSMDGASKPLLEGERCRGFDLTEYAHDFANNPRHLHIEWLIDSYQQLNEKNYIFFKKYFNQLAGNKLMQFSIENGADADRIRASWANDIEDFKAIRNKYLMY